MVRSLEADAKNNLVADLQVTRLFQSHAELRSRQVGQHGDIPAQLGGRLAQAGDAVEVFRGRAVREIHPRDIHPRAQDRPQHVGGIGGRAEGGDDTGAS